MVPVIELRGAIPYGLAFGLPLPLVLIVSVLGNMVPVPFIALFIRKIFVWMRKTSRRLDDIVTKLEERAHKKAKTVQKYKLLGLYILVAIPLPGTGAWTGSLVGALLDIRLKYLIPVVFAGVLTAGIIMSLISYGAGALFSFI
ncbi:MAG: small multi-drug export protein [Clostridia bacterium]|nr:small multi-drug export protein [Clostridia bacterium]